MPYTEIGLRLPRDLDERQAEQYYFRILLFQSGFMSFWSSSAMDFFDCSLLQTSTYEADTHRDWGPGVGISVPIGRPLLMRFG